MIQFTLLGWLLFRCNRQVLVDGRLVDDGFNQIIEMFTSFHNGWGFNADSMIFLGRILAFCLPLIIIQWLQFRSGDHLFILNLPLVAKEAVVDRKSTRLNSSHS